MQNLHTPHRCGSTTFRYRKYDLKKKMHPYIKTALFSVSVLIPLCAAVWLATLEPRADYVAPEQAETAVTLADLLSQPAEEDGDSYTVSAASLLQLAEDLTAQSQTDSPDAALSANTLSAEVPEDIGCASFNDRIGRDCAPVSNANTADSMLSGVALTAAASDESEEEPEDGFHPYTTFTDPQNGYTVSIGMSEYYQRIAYDCCQKYGVRFELAMGLFGAETSWNAEIGVRGSYVGIGMLSIYCNYSTYAAMGINIYTPEGSIEASIHLLSEKIAKYGSESKGLVAYNCGDSGAYNSYFRYGYTSSCYSRRVMEIAGAIYY